MPKSKSKRSGSLFDLLGEDPVEGANRLEVPTWWGKRKPSAPHRSEKARGLDPRNENGTTRPSPGGNEPSPADLPRAGGPDRISPARSFELDGACLRVSFTTRSAAVVIFVGMVLLVGAFEIGRRSGMTDGRRLGFEQGRAYYEAGATSDIEKARAEAPATFLIEDLLVPSAESGQPSTTPLSEQARATDRIHWVTGNTYVVVQEFSADRRADGLEAQAFVSERGVATELIALPTGPLQLWTTQGYNRKAALQRQMADRLLEEVRAIGREYFASGGGYKLEGYFKTVQKGTLVGS